MWFASGAGQVLIVARVLDITPPGTGIAGSIVALLGLIPAILLARRSQARVLELESAIKSVHSAPH